MAIPLNDIMIKSIKQDQGNRCNLYSWMIEWTMSEKQTNEMLSFCKERYNLLIKGVYYGQNMISEILVWT